MPPYRKTLDDLVDERLQRLDDRVHLEQEIVVGEQAIATNVSDQTCEHHQRSRRWRIALQLGDDIGGEDAVAHERLEHQWAQD